MTREARILGVDRRKMSKSYGNAINLSDTEDVVRKKVQSMVTDPARIKATDPGHPDVCNVYSYYQIFNPVTPKVQDAHDWCTGAKKGCTDCKKIFADVLVERMRPIWQLRKKYESEKGLVEDILKRGRVKASVVAQETLKEVKQLLNLYKG